MKPFLALAALEEGVVTPETVITSTGSISIQNPYDPSLSYVYKDWKAHGALTLTDALAWSSNVFFYYLGGGYGPRHKGLGIDRLKTYAELFGFGTPTTLTVFHEPEGLIPHPKWKEEQYAEVWRVGDTYNTVIGQYAFQVTPLQLARATAALANGGYLVEPKLTFDGEGEKTKLLIEEEHLRVVRTGMRKTVTEGTAKILNREEYSLAVKTGTAQIGRERGINSLLIGFFPYHAPRYAFAVVMEEGEEGSALIVAHRFFEYMAENTPEYLAVQ